MTIQPDKSTRRGSVSDWQGWSYLLIALTILLRVVHILYIRTNPTFWAPAVDPQWYDEAALRMLEGHFGPFPFFRAPLYPMSLAAVYAVFGHDLVQARILNVVFQAVTVWAIYRIGRSYFTAWIGIVAAWLFALNGMCIFYAGEILSTSMEMMASVFVLWATLRLLRDVSPAAVAVCGLAWGTAAIIRPNFLMIVPLAFLVVLWIAGNSRIKSAAIYVIALLIPILPITIANVVKGGEFVLIATQGGVNFWIGNNPEAVGILSNLPGYGPTWTMEDATDAAERDLGRQLSQSEVADYYTRKGTDFIVHNPLHAARLMIRKTALFFNHFEISNNKHITYFASLNPWLPFLINLDFGILFPLTLIALWVFWKRPETKIIVGMIILYAVSVILFFVTTRFRMPTIPWLVIFAAAGLMWCIDSIRLKSSLRDMYPVLLIIPGTIIVFLNLWNLHEAPLGWAKFMEGNAYLKLNQLEPAVASFSKALEDDESMPLAHLNLGVISYRLGRYEEAKQHYQDALRWDPNNDGALNDLGTVYETLGDTASAMEYYRRSIALRPYKDDARTNLAGVYFHRGTAALKLGKDSVAIAQLDTCVQILPTAAAYYNRAVAYGRHGDNAHAEFSLMLALQLDPRYQPARTLMAQLRDSTAVFP